MTDELYHTFLVPLSEEYHQMERISLAVPPTAFLMDDFDEANFFCWVDVDPRGGFDERYF
jgi:hypothetical protein